ncbi:GTP 3',8-cyclase MoaA [Pengzhenrongella frigida]|uniref:GTP 3',8-cyclase n=1 Tax=Pengzhenrongella frigida TaxID=1259133 RepID=A0A4Q5MZC4_9MICO|nr:GTP 3',8-cyclase MoaA [Cellulomonas sp. HLT2-17]
MPAPPALAVRRLDDQLGRPLRDLRISVTDRCNFRCVYCMPKEVFGRDHAFLPRTELLTFEEITRVARVAVAHGVEKIRLTGGEPLLRKDLHLLIGSLGGLRTPQGAVPDVALTTNGSLLARTAPALRAAGLQRVTVSLDSLDDATFMAMNDVAYPVAKVLDGIDAAQRAGLAVKVNMVVKRGHNDHDIVPMARHFQGTPVILRFIEYMDVGATNGWRMDEVVPSAEVLARIGAELPVEQVPANYRGETSTRWRYRDGSGEIGMISSVTGAFCHSCSRARVSTDGKLFTCLFATSGHDLRTMIRTGCTDDALAETMAGIWRQRTDRYSEERGRSVRTPPAPGERVEMSYIGG